MPSGTEASPKRGMAVINAISDTLSIGADGHGGGDQSTASACRGTGGGGNAWAGGAFAGSSGWFGISVLIAVPPGDAPESPDETGCYRLPTPVAVVVSTSPKPAEMSQHQRLCGGTGSLKKRLRPKRSACPG